MSCISISNKDGTNWRLEKIIFWKWQMKIKMKLLDELKAKLIVNIPQDLSGVILR